MAYAAAADVAVRLGRDLSPEEAALVDARLEDVERRIRKRIPDLDTQVAADDVSADDVIQVEADVVLRLVRNPQGLYSESDGTYSYQFSVQTASGKFEILPDEWAVLGVRPGGLFTLGPRIDRSPSGSSFFAGG